LGKKGLVTSKLRTLSAVSPELRRDYGKAVNEVKDYIEGEINRIESLLKEEEHRKRVISEAIDITLPGKFVPFGREHPVNRVLSEITGIFSSMGFETEEGLRWNRTTILLEALNMPKDHPARDMQDTFISLMMYFSGPTHHPSR
jgi:phenylalanyl-tRNA synthetase alpha chain